MTNKLSPFAVLIVAACLLAACSTGPSAAEPSAPEAPESGAPELAPVGPTATVDINCTQTNPHPIGEEIARTYDRTYEEVMTWFCLGDTFEDILLALETSEQTGLSVEDLLDRARASDWDSVWRDLGITE